MHNFVLMAIYRRRFLKLKHAVVDIQCMWRCYSAKKVFNAKRVIRLD